MKNIFNAIFLIILALISFSCMDKLEDDEMIEPIPIPEGVKIGNVELGVKYTENAFYSLKDNSVVKAGSVNDYDLAFESSAAGWHILLNSAHFMHAGDAGTKNFEEVTSQAGLTMKFDPSTGNPDSTAIGNWLNITGQDTVFKRSVYVIDLGVDEDGNVLGYKKVVFENLANGKYQIRHANLDGSLEFTSFLEKDETVSFVGFTFKNEGEAVHFEPAPADWDLFFGQYTTLLFAGTEPYPYLVRGVLTNRIGVQAQLLESEKTFEDVVYDDVASLSFDDKLDNIGHEWKYYNLEEGFYVVETERVYVIRNAAGDFYKMHFLSYFNQEGETGYPQFEYEKLEDD